MDFDTAMADSKDSAMKDVANHLNVRLIALIYVRIYRLSIEARSSGQVGPIQEKDIKEEGNSYNSMVYSLFIQLIGYLSCCYASIQTTIESQLRNAVQTQLDGVQKGLQTLQELEKTVREVRRTMSDVDTLYQDCAELSDVVNPIKEVNRKHQQVRTFFDLFREWESLLCQLYRTCVNMVVVSVVTSTLSIPIAV